MYKICFLLDKQNNWIKKYLIKEKFKNNKKYKFFISENHKDAKDNDIVFIIGYTKILNKNFLNKNTLNLVIHESSLAKGKGFAPIQWQILKNKNLIDVCLIEATQKVDSGDIFEKISLKIKKTALYDEIRESQAKATFKIIKKFLKKFPKIKSKKQLGISSYYKRRYPKDNKLNINHSIKKNFNLLRIGNNELFPSYFKINNQEYILKIYKKNKR